ncbi:uncharacterized protein LOC129742256 [Uranotaenia lowii]|uniref:uncharacterized protein LOC129742256 n=1 Tax=Uranotaenia lowii TaxID=190385 RepID=UPI00247A8596|nr:uncharacterized protein LOC129742256 [Uranotaenia lowii]
MDKLIVKRNVIEGRLRRTEERIEAGGGINSIDGLNAELGCIQELWQDFRAIQQEILESCMDVPSLEEHLDAEADLVARFNAAKAVLNGRVRALLRTEEKREPEPSDGEPELPTNADESFSSSLGNRAPIAPEPAILNATNVPGTEQEAPIRRSPTSVRLATPELHLPKGILPTFSGEYGEWSSFYDLFISAVHNNHNLTRAQKLFYLKTYTSGKAANIIKHVRVEDSAYEGALEALKRRFDRKDLIVAHQIQRFIEIPSFTVPSGHSLRRLFDTADDIIRALTALSREERDCWLIHLLLMKVDVDTRQTWIDRTASFEYPATMEEFLVFIDQRAYALETAHNSSFRTTTGATPRPTVGGKLVGRQRMQSYVATDSGTNSKCPVCQQRSHYLLFCPRFKALSPTERLQTIRQLGSCTNCLRTGHGTEPCGAGKCKRCNQSHHTLLHDSLVPTQVHLSFGTVNHVAVDHFSSVILATAVIWVKSATGERVPARALLDSGSQASFVTASLVERLQSRTCRIDIPLKGISGMATKLRKAASLTIGSRHSSFEATIECAILETISGRLPNQVCDVSGWGLEPGLPLADENFHTPANIDLLIGAGVFYKLLESNRIPLGPFKPVLQQTVLGWVVAGECYTGRPENPTALSLITTLPSDETPLSLNQMVARFWELETLVPQPILSDEEQRCEDHYRLHTTRDHTGRYVVKLPFKRDPVEMVETGYEALQQFNALCRQLQRDPEKRKLYEDYINGFITAGHISRAAPLTKAQRLIYLPHHGVQKESTTTKLRVVFNAAMKAKNGVALNDLLMTGPVIQKSLYHILLNFRRHPVALTGDIEKMYLQVRVSSEDSERLRMIWQEPGRKVAEYCMNTVTFGLTCAPFLATRTLKQLIIDEGPDFPVAQECIDDFYMDDCLTGAASITAARQKREQLTAMLARGGFPIRKWASNEPAVLEGVPREDCATEMALDFEPDATVKTLGIRWQCRGDIFIFEANFDAYQESYTKRQVLSTIAKIFDPLGLIGPVITIAKAFMQEIWKISCDWSDPLPPSFNQRWRMFLTHLGEVWRVRVPRRILSIDQPTRLFLHGYCDASELAYGAVVYLRAIDNRGNTSSRLLCSKSKVCPINRPTIPRSELCAAALLAELIRTVKDNLRMEIHKTVAFSDSMTALAWISGDPSRWKTFVANRVVQINEVLPAINWRHVPTKQNPADLLSRGAAPVTLASNKLWWCGPSWDPEETSEVPSVHLTPAEERSVDKEQRKVYPAQAYFVSESETLDHLLNKYSSTVRLFRVLAWIHRFVDHCEMPPEDRTSGPLTVEEIQGAERKLIRYTQHQAYDAEITALQKGDSLPEKSKLWPLTPFLDGGLLRVGGRLARSNLPYEAKHPWILPPESKLARLIFQQAHVQNHHLGAQALLDHVRRTFWVPKGRNLARNTVWNCVPCFKANPNRGIVQQVMGQLPPERLQQSPPFFYCGVDYGGPINIVERRGRGASTSKGYIALFVCFATRAVHIEAVSKLTTKACLAAFRRFIARRGVVGHVYSDNGTNFQGAAKEMRDWYQKIQSPDHNHRMANFLAGGGTQWHFNVPGVPHMGGLWEAGIKSAKRHLNIVAGNAKLTFEEFSTLLTEIEAILNSRPLSPQTSDPNDLRPLTPGHFLIGRPIIEANEGAQYPNSADLPYDVRFKYVTQLKNHFWERWSREYIPELMVKGKWQRPLNPLKEGDLVLIRSKNLVVAQWRLGRIVKLHPSPYDRPRLATIKVQSAEIVQTVHNLSKIPINREEN